MIEDDNETYDESQLPRRSSGPKRLRRVIRFSVPHETRVPPVLIGKRVLGIYDFVGSIHPCADMLCRLELDKLAEKIRSTAKEATLIASLPVGKVTGEVSVPAIQKTGWQPCCFSADAEDIGFNQSSVTAYDSFTLAVAAFQIAAVRPEVVVLCTSESYSVLALADAMDACGYQVPLVTVSVIGTSANRLSPNRCRRVSARMAIGRDCLKPLSEDSLPFMEIREFLYAKR